jgi:PPP family 3-phenylpropionic acid transporter
MYFGLMGLILPWFNLYCYHLGFSSLEIGIVSSTRTVIMVLFSLIWGILADRLLIRKPLYIMCNFASVFFWGLYLFYTDFSSIFFITIICSVFYGPIISFLEAITLDTLPDTSSYGKIRLWGSVSFIIIVTFSGYIAGKLPLVYMFFIICAGSLIMAATSLLLPESGKRLPETPTKSLKFLKKPGAWIFLFCTFLMLLSHGTYYGFFSIYMEQAGFTKTFTGIAWGTGTCAEIFILLYSRQILTKFRHKPILIFAMLVAALRWFILYYTISPVIILVSQCLHAFTYGAFHIASMLCFDEIAGEENRTFGQAIVNSASYGLGMMSGFILNGFFYGRHGKAMFIVSAVIALTGSIILSGMALEKKESRNSSASRFS